MFSNKLVLVKTNEQKQRRLCKRRVKGYSKSTKAPIAMFAAHTALPATVTIHKHFHKHFYKHLINIFHFFIFSFHKHFITFS